MMTRNRTKDPDVDVAEPVVVEIRITGPDLDSVGYGLDVIRQDLQREFTSGAVRGDDGEDYTFTVRNQI